ncbi:hypothetical protein RF11_00605 [Thelohanellus kitauei]|uniref:Uncharacterized protein n=1 Tax=Thelohanellus kitauei TaxID=669202 RepID=A0A0C2IVH7_THEKT|nr:hypothetical protein RF11_00605 [Thelohanellus kitauei]
MACRDNDVIRYYHGDILSQHGLDPIGFVEPHVVHYENTFVYSIGQEMFKSLHEVSTRKYLIELMILCLEECQESSIPEKEEKWMEYIRKDEDRMRRFYGSNKWKIQSCIVFEPTMKIDKKKWMQYSQNCQL